MYVHVHTCGHVDKLTVPVPGMIVHSTGTSILMYVNVHVVVYNIYF